MNKSLKGVYAITDSKLLESHFATAIEQSLQGGCRLIQYRDKSKDADKRRQQAEQIKALCQQYNALLIINDDILLAKAVNADGVHLGRDDSQIDAARSLLGDDKIIGVSCYNQLQLAIDAEQSGADYVAFGAFFNSQIKPDAPVATIALLEQAKRQLKLPICCIGGITQQNAGDLIQAGADMVAIISAIYQHDIAEQQVKIASAQFNQLFSA